jgi:hypothetical protein
MRTEFWLISLKAGEYLEEVGVDRRMILRYIIGTKGLRM